MASSHLEFAEGPVEVVLDVQNIGMGRVKIPELWYTLKSVCADNNVFWLGDMGNNPQIGQTLGGFHHRVVRGLAGMQHHHDVEGG